ncbi:MAG: hypothetical protein JOZ78_26695 [Chroococcidiopsidaceae cyanobacterium CP_BM_ER_R8_30]|nr:hypothetical protein [Chroococcidiopsidaceae cyanobacterium CP_BM_ER_R8_30]
MQEAEIDAVNAASGGFLQENVGYAPISSLLDKLANQHYVHEHSAESDA